MIMMYIQISERTMKKICKLFLDFPERNADPNAIFEGRPETCHH